MNKRYAIVRVDYDSCPIKYQVPQKHRKIKCFPFKCDKCGLYGDTKEQFEKKIAQVMLRKWLKGYLGTAMKPKIAQEQIEIVYKVYLGLAKEIVEFLGIRG